MVDNTKALATQQTAIQPSSWAEMREQAAVLVKSGFLPKHVDTAEKALAIMLTGRELGVPPMAAIRGMYVVDGKAVANGALMLALAQRTKELEVFRTQDGPDRCTVTVKRAGKDAITICWTDEETRKAGLANGFGWQKYPRIMRRWRAITEALRLAFADVLAGIYTPEELGVGYRVEGDDLVIDVQATPTPATTPTSAPTESPTAVEGEVVFDDLESVAAVRKRVEAVIASQGRSLANVQNWVSQEWALSWDEMTAADFERLEAGLATKKTNGKK